ncbi:uncharacterized protein LOC124193341 isoform X1 [Daphnia pulex]|uniref:uncharacterized protein LOC124193341 isoform X1 n=1 Tax=Daphnia pulex TaxID=6669 RepID=UPI001EE0217B|nr:uncharacterized protein LOC124193341 isoform X1 [Daphnia pulex]
MEEVTLKVDKVPPGTRILFAHNSSNASANNQQIKANATEIQFDLRNTSLVLPTETCGQMFLIAALWNHSSVNNKSLVAKIAWPFQVTCENADVDLALYVELNSFPLSSGIFSNNMTLIIGIPILQQLLDLKIYLANADESKTSFLRRTSPSLPKVTVHITPRKHSLLIKGVVSYKTVRHRLGDEILHRDQLIDVESDYSSSAINPGQKLLLNSSVLQFLSTSICGEAWMVFRLELEDLNVENNFAVIPVFLDCSALPEMMLANLGSCDVVPDEFSMGRSALMFTSLQFSGAMSLNAFLYKIEDKTYLPLRGNEVIVPEVLDKFRMIQLERNRLIKRNQCPSHVELRLNFDATLFGQLYGLIELLNGRLILSNQSEQQKSQQEQILLISQALGGLLVASTSYNSVSAYFMDSVLNGLFTYWPFFPFDISTTQSASTQGPKIHPPLHQSWHERFAKVVTHFMRKTIYADYEGKPNPDTGLQNFLNQLLWSPDTLEGPSLSKHSIDKLRQFLLMVLQKKLPTTFDDLPLEILNSLSFFSGEVTSPVPINEIQVKTAIETVFKAVQQTITMNSNLVRDEGKNDSSNNQEDVAIKLAVLSSLIEAINTQSIITRLTVIIQKIQESVSLNKQWILMEGMSDTAIDAELYCRLHALNRIRFRQDPQAENLFEKLHRITFWKRDSGVIYRGDISGITGRLYWNRVAVCHCDGFSPTKYHSHVDP